MTKELEDNLNLELTKLQTALLISWSAESSSDPENWRPDNPTWGQCAVTALIVQDYFGGEVVWAQAFLPDGAMFSHYFNSINGIEIDFTRSQFPQDTVIPPGVPKPQNFETTRDYILSYPDTQRRYELLKAAVDENYK